MFDIGFWELLVLAALGLLILGPERLPRVISQLARWLRQARRTASQLRWQIEHEVDLSERREADRKRREQPRKGPVDADGSASPEASAAPPATPAPGDEPAGDSGDEPPARS